MEHPHKELRQKQRITEREPLELLDAYYTVGLIVGPTIKLDRSLTVVLLVLV